MPLPAFFRNFHRSKAEAGVAVAPQVAWSDYDHGQGLAKHAKHAKTSVLLEARIMNWFKRQFQTQEKSVPFKTMAQVLSEQGKHRRGEEKAPPAGQTTQPQNIQVEDLPPAIPGVKPVRSKPGFLRRVANYRLFQTQEKSAPFRTMAQMLSEQGKHRRGEEKASPASPTTQPQIIRAEEVAPAIPNVNPVVEEQQTQDREETPKEVVAVEPAEPQRVERQSGEEPQAQDRQDTPKEVVAVESIEPQRLERQSREGPQAQDHQDTPKEVVAVESIEPQLLERQSTEGSQAQDRNETPKEVVAVESIEPQLLERQSTEGSQAQDRDETPKEVVAVESIESQLLERQSSEGPQAQDRQDTPKEVVAVESIESQLLERQSSEGSQAQDRQDTPKEVVAIESIESQLLERQSNEGSQAQDHRETPKEDVAVESTQPQLLERQSSAGPQAQDRQDTPKGIIAFEQTGKKFDRSLIMSRLTEIRLELTDPHLPEQKYKELISQYDDLKSYVDM